MARPNIDPSQLQSGMEGWDALLRDMLTAIAKAPFPVAEYANTGALPAANLYDGCLATTPSPRKLWFSNGTVWKEVSLL